MLSVSVTAYYYQPVHSYSYDFPEKTSYAWSYAYNGYTVTPTYRPVSNTRPAFTINYDVPRPAFYAPEYYSPSPTTYRDTTYYSGGYYSYSNYQRPSTLPYLGSYGVTSHGVTTYWFDH
ncbi:hypothetical protein AUJ14_05345 [Candidatus Micrarchaeota archaeon CG1_02_55_22]|nr:MAG: hypothetical protein AUJ14_05345 [Candidatus Micrarchaeota archaeon CG1_02_55_22]